MAAGEGNSSSDRAERSRFVKFISLNPDSNPLPPCLVGKKGVPVDHYDIGLFLSGGYEDVKGDTYMMYDIFPYFLASP